MRKRNGVYRRECLELAAEAVTQRGEAYGAPEGIFEALAGRMSITLRAVLRRPLTKREVVLLLLDLKQERAVAGQRQDTAVDIAGYGSILYELDRLEEAARTIA